MSAHKNPLPHRRRRRRTPRILFTRLCHISRVVFLCAHERNEPEVEMYIYIAEFIYKKKKNIHWARYFMSLLSSLKFSLDAQQKY